MTRKLLPIIGIFCLAAGGCTGTDVLVRKQVALEGTLDAMAKENAAQKARIDELSLSLAELQRKQKGTEADLDALRPGFDQFKASLESIYQRLHEFSPGAPSTQAQAPAQAAPEAAPVAAPATADAGSAAKGEGAPRIAGKEGYARAFAVFTSGNLPGAITAFEEFLRAEPESDLAPNALYWIGECYYAQQKFDRALVSFQRVVDEHPKARKVPDALLKIGFTHLALKDAARGRTELKALVEKFPTSQAAAKAREKLGRL